MVFFSRLAEIAGEYLKKGSQVYIEGALRTRKWTDKEGQERFTTEIVADKPVGPMRTPLKSSRKCSASFQASAVSALGKITTNSSPP